VVAEQLHAGVGDDDVRGPAIGFQRGEGLGDLRLVGDVHRDGACAIADLAHDAGSGRRSTVGDHDASTLGREPLRDGLADTGAGPRDQRGLAREACHQRVISSRWSMAARFLSSSSSRKIFFQSSLMMLSRPYFMAMRQASENGLSPRRPLASATWVWPYMMLRAAASGTPIVWIASCRASLSSSPIMQATVSTRVGSSCASCLMVTKCTSITGA